VGLAAPLACFFAFVGGINAANNYFGVAVNGQCEARTSCPGAAVPYNTANTLPATIRVTLPNGDKYLVNGQSSGSNNGNGTYLPFGPLFQVTYEGNATRGVSAADTIVVDWYASFQTTIGSGNFGLNLAGAFSAGVARSSSVTGCLNGNCQGPAKPPGSFNNGEESYTLDSSGGAFAFDNTYTFNFGAGSHVGSYIVINQTTALHPPAIDSFSPPSGQAGASVTITGTNLTGATAVTFRHAAASFAVNSATQITATVPCGAATGPIQVATTGGLATSKTFTVTAGTCWNAVDDFSITSNPHGVWSYGWAASFEGTFTRLATPQNPCVGVTGLICWWNGAGLPTGAQVIRTTTQAPVNYLTIVAPTDMLWLAVESNEVIVRWTAPATGTYSIGGSFTGIDTGQASVNVGVYQNGTTALAQGNISAYGQVYAFNIPSVALTKGTTIDFIGVDTDSPYNDSVGLIATISEVSP
jgi:hypothetical protein